MCYKIRKGKWGDATTLSLMTLSITPFDIMILSVKTFSQYSDTQHNKKLSHSA